MQCDNVKARLHEPNMREREVSQSWQLADSLAQVHPSLASAGNLVLLHLSVLSVHLFLCKRTIAIRLVTQYFGWLHQAQKQLLQSTFV